MTPTGFGRIYESAFRPVGSVPRRPLPKSKYLKSDLGFVDPSHVPAAMHESAYLKWFSKLSRPRGVSMTNAEYLRALEILRVEFGPYVVGGMSTMEEVLKDIDWSKSPGWPYVDQGCDTKKEAWDRFGDDITERAWSLVRGEYVECLFIATLKDELVLKGKNTRIFLPAPFHHQIACALLFKKACDSLTSTCHYHSSAIGLNIFGRGLERSLRRLEVHPFAYDADQSGCDTSCKDSEPERDFMKTGIPSQFHSGVDMVFNLAMCPRVMVGGAVLSLVLNPSGWYLTTVFNTLMTHRTIAGSYLDLYPQESINDMRENLLQTNGGDDLMFSTSKAEFDILYVAHDVARRGMYLETDVLASRNAMTLTFFSHNLYPRMVGNNYIYVACGRLSKILSAFSYIKTDHGLINWQRNASRVVGLMMNLWPYHFEYEVMYPYLYHMIHHFFLLDGRKLTNEWSGVFRSIPTDESMMVLRSGSALEGVLFFPPNLESSSESGETRVFQSALKRSIDTAQSDTFQTEYIPSNSQIFVQNQISPKFSSLFLQKEKLTMSTRNNRKIDTILDGLEKQNLLTPEGRAWLIAACDPFHDEDMRLEGYPDVMSSSTVVQLVKKTLQITVPTAGAGTVGAGNNWDCSISLFPSCITTGLNRFGTLDATNLLTLETTLATTLQTGALAVSAGPQGNTLWPNGATTDPAATCTFLNVQEYVKGNLRVIGMGFEVINTTSDLNRQGQVTAWRMPTLWSSDVLYTNSTTVPSVLVAYPYLESRFPPGNLSDAQLLYGSRSWAAAEGAYVVSRQCDENNEIQAPSNLRLAYVPSDTASNAVGNIYYRGSVVPPVSTFAQVADIHCPYDISGVHFTGLSFTTTLTVNVRWILERVPAPAEADLVVLATPSAPYDPLALELYCRCLQFMPPGVMLKENPLGEWFRHALSKVIDAAPKILKGISVVAPIAGAALGGFIPGAGAIGSSIGGIAGQLENVYKKPVLSGSASNYSTSNMDTRTMVPKKKQKKKKRLVAVPSNKFKRLKI